MTYPISHSGGHTFFINYSPNCDTGGVIWLIFCKNCQGIMWEGFPLLSFSNVERHHVACFKERNVIRLWNAIRLWKAWEKGRCVWILPKIRFIERGYRQHLPKPHFQIFKFVERCSRKKEIIYNYIIYFSRQYIESRHSQSKSHCMRCCANYSCLPV